MPNPLSKILGTYAYAHIGVVKDRVCFWRDFPLPTAGCTTFASVDEQPLNGDTLWDSHGVERVRCGDMQYIMIYAC